MNFTVPNFLMPHAQQHDVALCHVPGALSSRATEVTAWSWPLISAFFVRLEKEGNYTSIPTCVFVACTGINIPLLLGHTLTNFSPFNNTVALLIILLSAIHTCIVTSRAEVSIGFPIVAFWIMISYQVLVDHTASIFRAEDQNMKWVVTSISFKDHVHKLHKMKAWLGGNIHLHIYLRSHFGVSGNLVFRVYNKSISWI